jgi:hypothetical protein
MCCGASEIGPHDEERELTKEEADTGWYRPGAEPGSSANVIGGKIVTAAQMKGEYRREFVGNPLWHDKKYVADWQEHIRKEMPTERSGTKG